jgi:fatty-acyl-CoA synthase
LRALYTLWIVAVLAVLLPPLRLLLQFVPPGPRSRRLVRGCARLVVAATFCPVRVRGAETLRAAGSAMLVSNHASVADATFLLAALPIDLQFVANHAAAQYPILGLAVRRASYVIVDRGSWRSRAECGAAMVEALRRGHSLLVFPEGTTADAGGMLPFRSGAFRAAAQAGRPVVPIVLHGTRAMFPASGRLRRTAIEIEVLAPIRPEGSGRHDLVALKERSAAAIAAGLGIGI